MTLTRLRDQYDWVVLGDHPGALLSAAIVAKLGLSVLVLSWKPSARVKISRTGQILDPEPNFISGASIEGDAQTISSGLLKKIFDRIGLLPSELERFKAGASTPQVATPEARAHFALTPQMTERELLREFGQEAVSKTGLIEALSRCAPEMDAYWHGLPDRLTVVKTAGERGKKAGPKSTGQGCDDLRRWLLKSGSAAKLGAHPRRWLKPSHRLDAIGPESFRTWCEGAWQATTQSSECPEDLPSILIGLSLVYSSAGFQGGASAYRELLLRVSRRLGAHVPDKLECRRLFVESGRLVGVQVANRGNVIGAGGAIASGLLSHLRSDLSVSGRTWPQRLRRSATPKGWRFTLALTVRRDAIPPGMGSRLVWSEPGAPVLEVHLASPADYGVSDAANRYLFLRSWLPFSEGSLRPEYQRVIAARMFRQATELLPFLESHVVRMFPDIRLEGIEQFAEAYPYADLSQIPENLVSVEGPGVDSRSGVEGLFLSSAEVYPHLGTMAAPVAALEGSAWIAHRMGLAGPLG